MTRAEYETLKSDLTAKLNALETFWGAFGNGSDGTDGTISASLRASIALGGKYKCEQCGKGFNGRIQNGKKPHFCSKPCFVGFIKFQGRNRESTKKSEKTIFELDQKLRESMLKAHPVRTFKDMNPEEQAELRRQYERPGKGSGEARG